MRGSSPRGRSAVPAAAAATGLAAVIALALLGGCGARGGEPDSTHVARAIAETVADAAGSGGTVDLGEVVAASWDTFYAFPPHARPRAVEDALGFRWSGAYGADGGARITDRSGILLVFVDGDRVAFDVAFRRCRGDFGGDDSVTRGVRREHALYVVSETVDDPDDPDRGDGGDCHRLRRTSRRS